jgi:rhodanese-related sulfurtransferase
MRESGEKFLLSTCAKRAVCRGHAAGAMHLGKGVIERDIETAVPDKSACLVLYCGGGFRSALAGDNLRKMGYTNVISLDEVEGLRVRKPPRRALRRSQMGAGPRAKPWARCERSFLAPRPRRPLGGR